MAKSGSEREKLAERLRLAREQAGLSQAQVASLLKLHRPSVSEMEAGRRRVSAEELSRLAEIYDVDIRWLAGDDSNAAGADERMLLAARALSKLKSDDIEKVLKLLRTLRRSADG